MATGAKPARDQAQRVKEEHRRRRARRQGLIAAAIAVSLVASIITTMIILKVTDESDSTSTDSSPASSSIVDGVTRVPPAVFDAVGKGTVDPLPQLIVGQPDLTADNKPLIIYIGAEYCPFCASQRWAVVAALSRFGTFHNLGSTHSASDDVYPNTASLSFHGSTYTSDYVAFQGVETAKNYRDGNKYARLDTLTEQQDRVMKTINAPPYVPQEYKGSIPFMDFGNRYMVVGGTYDPTVLKGKPAERIAQALSHPKDPIAMGIIGTANAFTATICQLTGGQPAQVCSSQAARAYS